MPIGLGDDALGAWIFSMQIDGIEIAQFKEVSGLSAEIQVVEHKENMKGGIPIIKKLPGAKKWGDLTLKRGKTVEADLWKWIKDVQDGKIDASRKHVSVVMHDYEHGEKVRFNIFNAWPSKVSMSGLDAAGSAIAIEECTLVHEGLEVA